MTTTLAERLHQALAHLPGATQADLARHCGVRGPSVSNWFTGESKTLKADSLRRAAAFLKVDRDWLATGNGASTPALWPADMPLSIGPAPTTIGTTVMQIASMLAGLSDSRRKTISYIVAEQITHGPSNTEAAAIDALTPGLTFTVPPVSSTADELAWRSIAMGLAETHPIYEERARLTNFVTLVDKFIRDHRDAQQKGAAEQNPASRNLTAPIGNP